jgi:hypothetical protein
MKNFKKSFLTLTNGLKSSTEKKLFGQNLEKNLLKNRLGTDRRRTSEQPIQLALQTAPTLSTQSPLKNVQLLL